MGRALFLLLLLAAWARAQIPLPLWHTLGEGGILEGEAQAFNQAQSRYRIEPRFVGDYREMGVLLAAALRNGTAPPLAQVELGFLPVLVREGLVQTLPKPQVPDLDPDLLRLGEVKGHLYGYPLGISISVLFYNTDALRARRLNPPKDFAQLKSVAQGLSSRSARGLLFSADVYSFATLVLAHGGTLSQGDAPALDGESALRTLGFLQELNREGALQVRSATELISAGADFLRTKAFLAMGPSSLLPAVKSRTQLPFTIGIAPMPLEPAGKVAASGSVLVALRHASAEEKRGLEAFYRHMAEINRQLALARGIYYLPLNLKAQEAWAKEDVGRLLLGQKARLTPWHQNSPLLLWAPPLEEALERALKGQVPAKKALEEAQARALKIP
ncbi:sugar-binding protein [Thermus sp. 2.9]|uniref:extracellular solute-binding protein n=1 Tax=Thermus sp. (strain 2.9) TaxID=1577051 RepID=UPI0005423ABE|nr:extracellular solute-binding protein [Thermus sp. 2.9]KHG64512.1 sugar-binding protein [Thermus sp. 2.9]